MDGLDKKEWIDFYNSDFRIKNTYNKPYKIDDINGIKNKKIQNKYTHQKKSQTTYRIPPKKYIYIYQEVLLLMHMKILLFLIRLIKNFMKEL